MSARLREIPRLNCRRPENDIFKAAARGEMTRLAL